MSSPLLVKAKQQGREIVHVSPESAGWKYVGFRALRLTAGELEHFETGSREYCLVVLTGTVTIQIGAQVFADIGVRDSVFADIPPAALYAPSAQVVRITGVSAAAEIALCSAPCDSAVRHTRFLDLASQERIVRGSGSNRRLVRDILPHTDPTAASLLVVEVITPAGHSSSYPPHKHDTDNYPNETALEETYYHRIQPEQGFAFQRVYTDDRSLDEACAVENHDVVMAPRGYHPVVAPHGYEVYYLNVMAGPQRFWAIKNDPQHEWILQAKL